ncbi:MAG TPA: hypothetical protein VEZ20_14800 [Allosphingosinicella sp.]|jgi:hypothetical protein|nr:hypothetical protein [Allosphingosinicella sp.]
MDSAASPLNSAFDEIEASILPNLSLLLDGVLDAAGTARAGVDARLYAAEIRMLSLGVEELTRQVAALAPIVQPQPRLRMSA